MEIKEFVSTVIIQVVTGLNTAKEQLKENDSGAIINPAVGGDGNVHNDTWPPRRLIQQIEMSIAVTATDSHNIGGKAGLNIAVFSAEISGAKVSASNSTVNTVKFTVPIAFPVGK